MIAAYMNEAMPVLDTKRLPMNFKDSVRDMYIRSLSPSEHFSFVLTDGKDGNWFLCRPEKRSDGLLVLSYSVLNGNSGRQNIVCVFSVYPVRGKYDITPYHSIGFGYVSDPKIASKRAREAVKQASHLHNPSLDDVKKMLNGIREKLRKEGELG